MCVGGARAVAHGFVADRKSLEEVRQENDMGTKKESWGWVPLGTGEHC